MYLATCAQTLRTHCAQTRRTRCAQTRRTHCAQTRRTHCAQTLRTECAPTYAPGGELQNARRRARRGSSMWVTSAMDVLQKSLRTPISFNGVNEVNGVNWRSKTCRTDCAEVTHILLP